MSGASLQVTNVPHHVTQDEFSRLFGQAQGCIGSRLVKIGNSEPVGYLDFLDPPSAGNAISVYSRWTGWGGMGLIMRPAQPASASYPMKRDREDAVVDPRLAKQLRPAAAAYGAPGQGYGAQTEMRSPLHGQNVASQIAAQARGPAAQAGNTNSLAYGMDNVQPAPRSNASIPQAYAGAQSAQASLTPQQLEQQRVRAAIFSQTPASQGLQQPGYANDSRYPASSLPPLDHTSGGVGGIVPVLLSVVEDRGPSYAQQQQQQQPHHQGYQPYSQGNDMKAQQGSQFMAGGTLQGQIRPSGAADPINIGPGLLQSLQSLTQTQSLAPQQAYPQQQLQPQQQQQQYAPQQLLQPPAQRLQQPPQQQLPQQQQLQQPQHLAMPPMESSHPPYHQLPQQNGMQPSMLQEPPAQQPGQYGVAEIGVPVEEEELPPEAHHTLFASGLPLDMQKREASHIFRPFEGYKELRLVQKQDKQGKDVMWCFVEFDEVVQAARCMRVLQGYPVDEEEPEAYKMRISYARPPQAGPGSQRVPGQARREQGPAGRRGTAPPEQRREAPPHQADSHRQRVSGFSGPSGAASHDRRRADGPSGGGQPAEPRQNNRGGQERGRPPPGRGHMDQRRGAGRGSAGYNRR
ncbi:hypothetical protein CVIRNUC_010518 [Coccomyxa viridis]|uniref:RRM domain-containing protein n=1 Tax=Coccomyxa viridis TaxID=1274662 RepID=A0AAV1ILG4_9CHLO|nr:hypothetical protein CVIRNUC_010518 [Coccomyxa viridis]